MYTLVNTLKLNSTTLNAVTRRMASSYLISDPKYAFLKDLQLSETNLGVFNGRWFGDGEVERALNLILRVNFLFFLFKKRKLIQCVLEITDRLQKLSRLAGFKILDYIIKKFNLKGKCSKYTRMY